uniref:ADF-H domain-containing protein n=1 Tax=Syphacia muris TaxID=451379 RepID=A0A0N5AWB2_9BILA
MSSGVVVSADCQSTFQKLSEGKDKIRYIFYKIEEKEVVVEAAVTVDQMQISGDDYEDNSKTAYEAFVKDLKDRTNGFKDCRYAVFDFKFTCQRPGAGASKMDKLVFIQFCPDGAPIKNKMVYASTASAIKQCLGTAILLQFQVSDEAEMAHKELLNKLIEKYRDN